MTFALITEGASEHIIIRHLLEKYFKDTDPDINQIQPKLKSTGEQLTKGGWNEVLKYCEDGKSLKEILLYNDYLIIQIDTDQSQQAPFNISHLGSGKEKSDAQLYTDITERLKQNMPETILSDMNKIIFAICIHTAECWLLPLFCSDNIKSKTKGCLKALNNALRKNNASTISEDNQKNNQNSKKAYREILKQLSRRKDIEDCAKYNYGFQAFVTQLNAISPIQ